MDSNYMGIKRITVSSSKYNGKKKTSYIKSSGVMNFPEENIGSTFEIKGDENEFSLIQSESPIAKKVRKAGRQTVITIGTFIEETSEYECYKIDEGYFFKKAQNNNHRGLNHEIITIKEKIYNGKKRRYFCISLYFLQQIQKNEDYKYIKIEEVYEPDFYIKVEMVKEAGDAIKTKNNRIRYVLFDNRSKTISASLGMKKHGIVPGTELTVEIKDNALYLKK